MRSGVYVLGAVVVRWYDVITHRGLNAAGLWTTSKEWQNILKVRVGVLHYITGNDYSTLMKMHYTVLYYTVTDTNIGTILVLDTDIGTILVLDTDTGTILVLVLIL